MDRLTGLLQHFRLQARVFNNGPLCTASSHGSDEDVGHIHILKHGSLRLEFPGRRARVIEEPTIVFLPKPTSHRLVPGPEGAHTVCGAFSFGAFTVNPLQQAFDTPVVLPLGCLPSLEKTLDLLFEEAFTKRCGHQTALDRLCELVIIQLIRHLMDHERVDVGLLAGLANPRLSKALMAMHERPSEAWTLLRLAERAGMSRARFAATFRSTIGQTPGGYLACWRICLAQGLLRQGQPLDLVAHSVGYSGPPALARIFKQQLGQSPTQWLKHTCADAACSG